MKNIIIEHIDCVGITIDKFEVIPSNKEIIGRSRICITTEDGRILGYFKVYDDETIEFVNYNKTNPQQ